MRICSSLLCGRTEKLELGSNSGAGAALALALVRPPSAPRTPCQLSLTAPEAAAFAVRLIDVKEKVLIKENIRKVEGKIRKKCPFDSEMVGPVRSGARPLVLV
ncbi:unnamed protein product [Spodoptera exigua]|nr:unnamed protein product [Spodoptera exigua]